MMLCWRKLNKLIKIGDLKISEEFLKNEHVYVEWYGGIATARIIRKDVAGIYIIRYDRKCPHKPQIRSVFAKQLTRVKENKL
jgi:hypothetical protein